MEDRIDTIWNKDERQEIVDSYLSETKRNMFKVDQDDVHTIGLKTSPIILVTRILIQETRN